MNMKVLVASLLAMTSFAQAQQIKVRHEVPRVLVEMRWAQDLQEVRRWANDFGACPKKRDVCHGFSRLMQVDELVWICEIVAVKPKSWTDTAALETIAHEQMHCLGFDH